MAKLWPISLEKRIEETFGWVGGRGEKGTQGRGGLVEISRNEELLC